MLSDLRLAFRQLRKSPGFSAVVILTLALGIGACTTIFSVVHSALLRPLPYPDADRLVQLWTRVESGTEIRPITGPQFKELREHATSFEQLAIEFPVAFNLLADGRAERVHGLEVSANYLATLGIVPQHGQTFPPHADQIGGETNVVLLTDVFWRTRFGADPAIVGRTVTLNQVPRTVVGVLPPHAIARNDVGFLVPLVLDDGPWRMAPDGLWASAVGRLKPGVTLAEAQGQAAALTTALQSRLLPDRAWNNLIRVRPLHDGLVAEIRPILWLLFAAVGFVLLIACANVANLALVRAVARQREMAVRSALGAGTGRIVRQVLVESVTLALLGGAAGVLLALLGVDLAGRAIVSHLPGALQPGIDVNVLGFSLALAGGTGVAFGLFPAWRARRINLTDALKESGRSTSAGRARLQASLVVAEVALTAALLIGAGLLLRSFTHLLDADLGFEPQHALVADVALSRPDPNAVEHTMEIHRELLRRLSALPGVEAVGTSTTLPLSGEGWGGLVRRADQSASGPSTRSRRDLIGGRYFEAMGIALVRGRSLTDNDNRRDAPLVTVLNEALAAQLFPDSDAVGRHVVADGQSYEVVGIVRNIRHVQVERSPDPHLYLPHVANPFSVRLVLRTRVPPSSLADDVRREVTAVDPGQSAANVRTLEQAVSGALQARRVTLVFISLFAAGALALACLGLYGVMAYTISQREREFGIRLALGAAPRDLLRFVLRDGLRLVSLGVAIGLLAALAATRLIASLLYGVGANDPLVFVIAPLVLGVVALAACWLPARRATRVDPMTALRAD